MENTRRFLNPATVIACTGLLAGAAFAQQKTAEEPMKAADPAGISHVGAPMSTKPSTRGRGVGTPDCPAGSLFTQLPNLPADAWAFTTSDNGPTPTPFLVQEDVQPGGLVTGVRFWGIQAFNGGGGFAACSPAETPLPVRIIFYSDVDGAPGTALPGCTYDLNVTPVSTGLVFAGAFTMQQFDAVLTPGCSVGNGWVSIEGRGVATCWFLWAAQTPGGAGDSLQNGASTGENQSICLTGTAQSGACCNDTTGVCTNQLSIAACLSSGGSRYLPGTTCASAVFVPACGAIPTGACCFGDGSCQVMTSGNCNSAGGEYSGAGTNCSPNNCAQPPANDDCADAIALSTGVAVNGSTTNANSDVTGTCVTTEGANDVWYSIVGTGNTLTALTCGSGFDTKLHVFAGSCDGLVCVTGNDDACGLQSTASWCSELGVTYLISLNGFGTASGTYTLVVNDDGFECNVPTGRCCFSDSGTPCPADIAGNGSSTPDGTVNVFDLLELLSQWNTNDSGDIASAGGSTPDGTVNVFDLLALLAQWGNCPARGGGAPMCMVTTLGGCGDVGGTFVAGQNCDASCPVQVGLRDTCEDAEVIPSVPYIAQGTTAGATDNYREDCNPEFPPTAGVADVVFRYTPTSNQNVRISLCGSSYDTLTYVFATTCGGDLSGTAIACNDDNEAACGPGFRSQIDSVQLTAGTTYFIVVDGFAVSGAYELLITLNP